MKRNLKIYFPTYFISKTHWKWHIFKTFNNDGPQPSPSFLVLIGYNSQTISLAKVKKKQKHKFDTSFDFTLFHTPFFTKKEMSAILKSRLIHFYFFQVNHLVNLKIQQHFCYRQFGLKRIFKRYNHPYMQFKNLFYKLETNGPLLYILKKVSMVTYDTFVSKLFFHNTTL